MASIFVDLLSHYLESCLKCSDAGLHGDVVTLTAKTQLRKHMLTEFHTARHNFRTFPRRLHTHLQTELLQHLTQN